MMRIGGPSSASRKRVWAVGALLSVCLCVLLAACSGGTPSTVQVATDTATTGGSATATPTSGGAQTPQPTVTPVNGGTPGAQLGSGNYCASPPNVSAALPGNIPTYPGAQMFLGQAQGSTGVFALCTGDSVQAVDTYYFAQLPSNHWGQVTNTAISTSKQLTAVQNKTNLVITIEPDTAGGFQTQVVILYSGS